MAPWRSRGGATSVEVLIGIAIIALAATAAFGLLAATLSATQQRVRTDQAQALAEEGLGAARQIRAADFQALVPGAYGLARSGNAWTFAGTQDVTDATFTRQVTVSTVDEDTRDVSVAVSWMAPGRVSTVTRSMRLTNWFALEVWGNWGIPTIVGSVDLGPNASGTGVALRGDKLYISASVTAQNKPSFSVADVSDPTNPVIVGNYTSGRSFNDVEDVPDSNLVYAVGVKADEEFFVFDVSDPAAPAVVRTLDLNANGLLVHIHEGWLYVGVANGLKVFDIADPADPVLRASLDLGADAVDIAFRDAYAYVATNADESEIRILDVSDPPAAAEVASLNVPTTKDSLSVSIRTSRLYVGTTSGTGNELYRYDLSNPTSPSLLVQTEVGGDLNSLIAAGPYLFSANNISNSEFVIYRVTGSGAPTIEAQLNMSQVATDLDFVDNTIYIVLRSNDAVQILQPAP